MMFGFGISEGVKVLCKSMIENPHDWVQGSYEFIHRTHRDLSIWTANGLSFIHLNGNKGFNLAEKRYINRAIKQSIANRLITPKHQADHGEDELVVQLEKWRDWLNSKIDMVQVRFDCPPEPGTHFDYELSLLVSEMSQAIDKYHARKGDQAE